jgi:hypothetical protein
MLSIERVAEVGRYQRITENFRKDLLDINEIILLFSHVP